MCHNQLSHRKKWTKAVAVHKHNGVVFDDLLSDEFANVFAKFRLQQIITAFV